MRMLSRSRAATLVLAASLVACEKVEDEFLVGPSPITTLSINQFSISPIPGVALVRGGTYAYSLDVRYDYREDDFIQPQLRVELWMYNDNTETFSCGVSLQTIEPSEASGRRQISGSFTVRTPAQCTGTYTDAVLSVRLFSGTTNHRDRDLYYPL